MFCFVQIVFISSRVITLKDMIIQGQIVIPELCYVNKSHLSNTVASLDTQVWVR